MILAGDIGGTKTALALFEPSETGIRELRGATFPSRTYGSLEAILEEFLKDGPRGSLEAACFGVAGRVHQGKARTTNLPWCVDAEQLANVLGTRRVRLVNDLEAAAYGMLFLAPDQFEWLHPGRSPQEAANIAIIAPGTGLGEAILYWDEQRYRPIASEGGHADFAPRTDQEIALLKCLRARLGGHVSYERVLSGDGICNIYSFLRDAGDVPEPPWLRQRLESGDRNVAITQVGLSGEHPLCVEALDLFCSILGAEAANLALKCLATAGVIVGGGIAPKILPALKKGTFMKGFTDKGRFSDWLRDIPVRVALHPRAPLLGAARYLIGPSREPQHE